MTIDREHRLRRFFANVAGRDGVFSWAQASEFGLTQYEIANGLRTGNWNRYHGVYQLSGAEQTSRSHLRAVLLRTGRGSCATGPSALALWGFDALPGPWSTNGTPCVILPPGRHLRVANVDVLRDSCTDLRSLAGIDTVTRERAVVDTLRVLSADDGRHVLYRALQLRWIHVEQLELWCEGLKGRRGKNTLKLHLKDARAGSHAESERVLARHLRQNMIVGWQANTPIYDDEGLIGYGDAVFSAERLVIEGDGRAWHSDVQRFQRDRTRQNRLINAGWRVLRYTWADLTEDPAGVVRQIRQALEVSST